MLQGQLFLRLQKTGENSINVVRGRVSHQLNDNTFYCTFPDEQGRVAHGTVVSLATFASNEFVFFPDERALQLFLERLTKPQSTENPAVAADQPG